MHLEEMDIKNWTCCECKRLFHTDDEQPHQIEREKDPHCCCVCQECYNEWGGNINGCIGAEPCWACQKPIRWPPGGEVWGQCGRWTKMKCYNCIKHNRRINSEKTRKMLSCAYCADISCKRGSATCRNWSHYDTRD